MIRAGRIVLDIGAWLLGSSRAFLLTAGIVFSNGAALADTSGNLGNDVIYSIVIDRFFSGNYENDIPDFAFAGDSAYEQNNRYWLYKMFFWHARENRNRVSADGYWGGDLQGVVDKLDYLHWLGVTTVLLSPVFENVNGYHFDLGGTAYHGYWTKDFMRLEEHFVNPPGPGETLENVMSKGGILKQLIDKAHSYDPPIKVVLDVALNHTSPAPIDTTLFDDSNYLEMGVLFDNGRMVSLPCTLKGGKTCRETYVDDGWFHPPSHWVDWNDPTTLYDGYVNGNLADLDQRNPKVRAYLLRALKKWLALGLDGFRLDAVKNIYPDFLSEVESQLREVKPDVILIGEYFDGGIFENGLSSNGLPRSVKWLEGMPHTTMFNFSFATAARDYFTGRMDNLGTPYVIRHIVDPQSPHNPLGQRSNTLVNFINNHDIPRMLSLSQANGDRYAAALKLLFVAPGVPKLLYGDEIGLAYSASNEHWKSHDKSDPAWTRLMMPWEKFEDPRARRFLNLTRSLIRLRKETPFLKDGAIAFLSAANLINIFEKNTYIAIQRTPRGDGRTDAVVYLYSTKKRDRLEFEIDLPDGVYTDLSGRRTVLIDQGQLVWRDVAADESLVVSASTRTSETR